MNANKNDVENYRYLHAAAYHANEYVMLASCDITPIVLMLGNGVLKFWAGEWSNTRVEVLFNAELYRIQWKSEKKTPRSRGLKQQRSQLETLADTYVRP